MARIWYSVCGEGLGHAVRSDSILEKLVRKHDVLVTAAEKAYHYLKKRYRTHYIFGNTLVYRKNRVNNFLCVAKFLVEFPYKVLFNTIHLVPRIILFKPDIIISDFESASHYIARIFGIPCISIDNIHFETETRFECPKKKPWYLNMVIRFLHPSSDMYLVFSFSKLKPKSSRVKIVRPTIREKVKRMKPKKGEHVLVYQTSPTNRKMLSVLEKTGNEYRIYGMKEKDTGNLVFRRFSETGFLGDLAASKYVIINGGFTTLSEALYLKKPVLCIPIEKQFEQFFNAYQIEKRGFGSYCEQLNLGQLNEFEKNLEKYKENIEDFIKEYKK